VQRLESLPVSNGFAQRRLQLMKVWVRAQALETAMSM
jgi:hypothetical protein